MAENYRRFPTEPSFEIENILKYAIGDKNLNKNPFYF